VVNALALAVLLAVTGFVPALQPGDTVPALPLIDQSGHAFSLAQLRGNAVVLTFIYTRCADPTMCPLVSLKYARLQHALGNAPVRLVEITLDPAFDTPPVLRAYGRAYGADPRRWTLATGAPGSIDALAARLGVASQWTQPGTLVHTEAAVILDRSGAIAGIVDGNAWTPAAMAALARDAAGEHPAPLARLGTWLTAAIQRCGGGAASISTLEMLALAGLLSAVFGAILLRSLRSSGRA
jgi:cytochrome oxidase Cu insertion factor (SCO1/SenC/PrrC family)